MSWLNSAYTEQLPACLVPFSPASGDAELALAVHLGQLAVASGPPQTPDWGPHLLVCPRVLLAAWRTRLASVCPGLRVVCVAGNAGGGSGRRLRLSVARGQVNICLTTYAALRSRPSRFSGIRWSVVVIDQVSLYYPCFIASRVEECLHATLFALI